MRLTLRQQILFAPSVVLLLLTLLLGFMQYTYWDLSVKRQEARILGSVFISLAEADLASQRMAALSKLIGEEELPGVGRIDEMAQFYAHLALALQRVLTLMPLSDDSRALLRQAMVDLNPEHGFDADRFLSALAVLRPRLATLSETSQEQRERLRDAHNQDIDALVARTALISIVVLGVTVLLGVFVSLTFARRLLRRIDVLSACAGRIAAGELTPPPAPAKARDELDDLSLSLNRMTERLIRVVGAEKLLEGAEEERRRIAMDIHDQTLSDLSSVLRGIQELTAVEPCREVAAGLEEELRRAMGNLREVMDNLHPQTLEILGLGAALQSHLERHLTRDNLPEYHLYVSAAAEGATLSRLARLTVYRIAVEAVHNVIKHARATRYEVSLDCRGRALVLAVEDNGGGFDPAAVASAGGRGLNNMRERANAIGAAASWGPSRFTSGTRFELTLPLNGGAKEG